MFSNPETFLGTFTITNEPFVILEERIHTLHRTNGDHNDNFLCYSGETFSIEESVAVTFSEKSYYDQRKDEVEREVSRIIRKKFVDPLKKEKEELQRIDNFFSTFQDDSIERFIMVDVFEAYHSRYNPRNIGGSSSLLGLSRCRTKARNRPPSLHRC